MIRRSKPLARSTKPIRSRNSPRKCTFCWTGKSWLPLCPKTCPHCKGTGIEPRKPIPRKRAKPRRGPMRDPGYLEFLRVEGKCVACRRHCARHGYRDCPRCTTALGRCDPAHYRVNGRGSKGPDKEAIPLCREHHEQQTREGHAVFSSGYEFDWLWEAAAHYAVYQIWKEDQA